MWPYQLIASDEQQNSACSLSMPSRNVLFYKSLRVFGFDFRSANLLQSFYLQSHTLPSSWRALIHSIDSQSIALANLTHFTDQRQEFLVMRDDCVLAVLGV